MGDNLRRLITTCTELGAARLAENLGLTAGEMSQRRATEVYGKWFVDAYRDGRIHPVRVDNGRNGTRWYRVVDILELKAYDSARAELR